MILNYLEEGWFHIFAVGKSNANFYCPIEPPKVTALRKWPHKNFSPPNEQSIFRSTYAEFRNSKSLHITKKGKVKFMSPLLLITTVKFSNVLVSLLLTAISVWPWKVVSVNVRYLFYQRIDDKIKTWTLRFPALENPHTEKALFDWPIVLQYQVKAKYRLISRKFWGMKLFHPERTLNQPKATRVSIHSITNYIASFPFACCFYCSRVFISRSYENRTYIEHCFCITTALWSVFTHVATPAATQRHWFCIRKSSTSPGLL